MAKDENVNEIDNEVKQVNTVRPESEVASSAMSVNNAEDSLKSEQSQPIMSGIIGEVIDQKASEVKETSFETNKVDEGGNFVPLIKEGGNCPPLQYRPRSSGAINGMGYDAGIMQDNTRSVRQKKKADKADNEFEDVNFKKPKPLWLKITIIVVSCILGICAVFGVYIGYLEAGCDRIYNAKYLEVRDNRPAMLAKAVTYDVVTYNLNYGAFSSDYTYYKSVGKNLDGSTQSGTSSRAFSKDRVEINTKGSAGIMSTGSNAEVEFFMFQEVDVDSTRTYYVDERQILKDVFLNYAEVFAETASSNYIFAPLTSPIGKVNSGMVTYSAFEVDHAMRYTLPSNESFPSKYSSNDNCVSIVKCGISGVGDGELFCLINVNVSMYEDEEIRLRDLEALYKIMEKELAVHNNYVVVGGSFSYLLYGEQGVFENKMITPDWCTNLPECFSEQRLNDIGFRIIKDDIAVELKTGTIRDCSVSYKEGSTFEAITDGFIVSNNIVVEKIQVLDGDYLYSAHNPVRLTFRLK